MGGRGATSSGGGNGGGGIESDNRMNVPFDEWGEMVDQYIPDPSDENSNLGYIRDEYRYTYEPFDEKLTKKEALEAVEAWKNDDGTYGTGDESIYLAYKDGTFLDLTDSDTGNYKKSGITGVYIMTGDDEYAWGGEVNKKTGKVEPWTTWVSPEDEKAGVVGKTNTHSGYNVTGQYIARVKTTWRGRKLTNGAWQTTKEVIRQSAVKPIDPNLYK